MSDSEIPRSEKLREATTSLIRKKMSNIYEDEPGYNQELKEITHNHKNLSKHQLFIQELHQSGKPSHEIQLEWHKYYEGLPDDEKQGFMHYVGVDGGIHRGDFLVNSIGAGQTIISSTATKMLPAEKVMVRDDQVLNQR